MAFTWLKLYALAGLCWLLHLHQAGAFKICLVQVGGKRVLPRTELCTLLGWLAEFWEPFPPHSAEPRVRPFAGGPEMSRTGRLQRLVTSWAGVDHVHVRDMALNMPRAWCWSLLPQVCKLHARGAPLHLLWH